MFWYALRLFTHFIKSVSDVNHDNYDVRNLFESIDARKANKLYKSIHLSEISFCDAFSNNDNEYGCVIVFSSSMNHHEHDVVTNLYKFIEKYNVTGYIVDRAMCGRYIEQRQYIKFDKKSLTIELMGLSDEQSIKLAKDLCNVLEQQSVLVRSINTKSIWCITKLK